MHGTFRFNGGKWTNYLRSVATGLLETYKKSGKRGPSKSQKSVQEHSKYDRLDHLIVHQEKQTRCEVCHKKVQNV